MLEHSSLVVQAWTRTILVEGVEAWIRAITDSTAHPLGFVRWQKPAEPSWFFWRRKARLDVFETQDASHLMTLTRSWTMLRLWDVHDAEERHIGTIYPKRLVANEGQLLGFLDLESARQGRIFDLSGHILLRFAKKTGDDLEVTFAQDQAVNPFLRMLMLGCLLTLNATPKRGC